MKVEIWSDVVCPFCYIGKRKFEAALQQSGQVDVEITWRSFQLDPDMEPAAGMSVDEYLSKRKGIPVAQAREMNGYVTGMAKEVGLDYRLDQAKLSNTLDAHRLLHFAKEKGLQGQLKEALFNAYYTQGADIGDINTLTAIAVANGMNEQEVKAVLQSDTYTQDVRNDQLTAQQIGVQGVPFFVFNNKYAVSGAQAVDVFQQVLSKVREEKLIIDETLNGGTCTPDGVCD